jgi:hypothetical protein
VIVGRLLGEVDLWADDLFGQRRDQDEQSSVSRCQRILRMSATVPHKNTPLTSYKQRSRGDDTLGGTGGIEVGPGVQHGFC